MTVNFATRYCSWCGRSIAGRQGSALVRLWRRSIWIPRMDCRSMPKRYDSGCWQRACGAGRARGGGTVAGGSARSTLGELVQMDGSFHRWLEERGPEGCLIDMVDDATSKTLARMGEEETIWAVADTLRTWIER